ILCDLPPPPPGRPTQRGPFSATSDGHIVRAHTQPSSPRYRAKCTPFSLVLSVTGHPHTGTHTDTHTPAHTHTHTHYTHAHTHADTHTQYKCLLKAWEPGMLLHVYKHIHRLFFPSLCLTNTHSMPIECLGGRHTTTLSIAHTHTHMHTQGHQDAHSG